MYFVGVVFHALLTPALLLFGLVLLLTMTPLPLPDRLKEELVARIHQTTNTQINIDRLFFYWGENWHPTLRLNGVELTPPQAPRISLERLDIALERLTAKASLPAPKRINGVGLKLAIERDEDGGFRQFLSPPPVGADYSEAVPIALLTKDQSKTVIENLDALLAVPSFQALEEIEISAIAVRYHDKRLKKGWMHEGGTLRATRNQGARPFALELLFPSKDEQSAKFSMSLTYEAEAQKIRIKQQFEKLALKALSEQIDALDGLIEIDGLASGNLELSLSKEAGIEALSGRIGLDAERCILTAYPEENIKNADFSFTYSPENRELIIDRLEVASKSAQFTGNAAIRAKEGWPAQRFTIEIFADSFWLAPNDFLNHGIDAQNVLAVLHTNADFTKINLEPTKMPFEAGILTFDGTFSKQNQGWDVVLDASIDKADVEAIKRNWPKALKQGALRWIERNIHQAQFENIRTGLRLSPSRKPEFELNFDFSDTQIGYIPRFPPLKGGKGRGNIKGAQFHAFIDEGYVEADKTHQVTVKNIKILLDELAIETNPVEIDVDISGDLPSMLRFLDNPPLGLVSGQNVSLDVGTGAVDTSSKIKFRIKKELAYEDISFTVNGSIKNLVTKKLVEGRTLSAPTFRISASEKAVKIGGAGTLDGVKFDAHWQKNIRANAADKSLIKGRIELSEASLSRLGIAGGTGGVIFGKTQADIDISLAPNRPIELSLRSDLAGMGAELKPFSWRFDESEKGALEIDMVLGQTYHLKRFDVEAGLFRTKGSADFTKDFRVEKFKLDNFHVGSTLDVSANYLPPKGGRKPRLEIGGSHIDLSSISTGQMPAGISDFETLSLKLDRLKVTPAFGLDNFKGTLDASDGFAGNFSADFFGGEFIAKRTNTAGACYVLHSLEATKIFDTLISPQAIQSNDMRITLRQNKGANSYDGHAKIKNLTLKEFSLATNILSTATIIGALERLLTSGLFFEELDLYFTLRDEKFIIKYAYMSNSTISVYFAGTIDLKNALLDLNMVVSPFAFFNGITAILTGNTKGILGFDIAVKGSPNFPEVASSPIPLTLSHLLRGSGKIEDIKCESADAL